MVVLLLREKLDGEKSEPPVAAGRHSAARRSLCWVLACSWLSSQAAMGTGCRNQPNAVRMFLPPAADALCFWAEAWLGEVGHVSIPHSIVFRVLDFYKKARSHLLVVSKHIIAAKVLFPLLFPPIEVYSTA